MNATKLKKIGFITLVSISTIVILSIITLFIFGLNYKPISDNKKKDDDTQISEQEKKEAEELEKTLYFLEF